MKTISAWLVAVITSGVSLAVMCVFDLILSIIYYYIGKIAFLTDILDYFGEILDLGLTAIVAMLLATAVWRFGHKIVEKIKGEEIEFEKGPVYCVNHCFFFAFIVIFLFLSFQFVMLIGAAVTNYTADLYGFAKILMFFKAIKDTVVHVCSDNLVLYKISANSFLLSAIQIFGSQFV